MKINEILKLKQKTFDFIISTIVNKHHTFKITTKITLDPYFENYEGVF